MIYVTKRFDRLDRIAQERYGHTQKSVEFILENNPGLDEQGIVLPHNLRIFLPDMPPAPSGPRVIQRIQLWS